MRARTVILLVVALILAGGTTMMARVWLTSQRAVKTEAAPIAVPTPAKSVLIARKPIERGQILKPSDLAWEQWPEGGLDKNYILLGTRTPETYSGWVAKQPIAAGEPLTESKSSPRQSRLPRGGAAPRHARGVGAGVRDLGHFRLCLSRRHGRPDRHLFGSGSSGPRPAECRAAARSQDFRDRAERHSGHRHRPEARGQAGRSQSSRRPRRSRSPRNRARSSRSPARWANSH